MELLLFRSVGLLSWLARTAPCSSPHAVPRILLAAVALWKDYEREGWARRFFENWRASLKWRGFKSGRGLGCGSQERIWTACGPRSALHQGPEPLALHLAAVATVASNSRHWMRRSHPKPGNRQRSRRSQGWGPRASWQSTHRTQGRERVSQALESVRQVVDGRYRPPPAQNHASGIPARGSHLGCGTAKRICGHG